MQRPIEVLLGLKARERRRDVALHLLHSMKACPPKCPLIFTVQGSSGLLRVPTILAHQRSKVALDKDFSLS